MPDQHLPGKVAHEMVDSKVRVVARGRCWQCAPHGRIARFAVFLVFLVHYVTLITPWIQGEPSLLAFSIGLHSIRNVGVDLFFVLSGFLIYGSLIARPQKFSHFMSRRIVRIYPAFLAVFVIYIALSFL